MHGRSGLLCIYGIQAAKRKIGMDISLFLESPFFANVGLHAAPDPFPRTPFPFAPMTFLFAMDEIEAIGAKARSSISHFPQKMYNIDTDF